MLAFAVSCGLTACSGASPAPSPSSAATATGTSTSTSTPTPVPTFDPKGTASQNRGFFDHINESTIAANPSPSAEQFVNALAAAGFDKSAMQMTADTTTVNLKPGSVQFSVLINGGCLIGQFGQDIGGYHSMVASVLSTGKCLIGDTVPIK
ncbi:DUF6993 domain-containing protein [Humibacter albus]|uniref:DUF6993 domain-containing protein n=1 Tax=Humibacter albus TaxID=427754 RepID=UPI0006869026|nr:hypothetical protein [Humibacter albus]